MSEPRRPEDGSTQSSTPAWDQPASTGADASAESQPTDQATARPPEEPSVGTPTYEPVSADTTYQPAYTQPASSQAAYPPAYQQPEQSPYPGQYQQPAYPPAYEQPASAWGQSSVATEERDHAHSLGVGLASLFLGFWGLLFTLFGILLLVGGGGFTELIRNDPQLEGIDPAQIDQVMSAFGVGAVIMLLIGIPHLLAAVGAPLHKGWARWIGVIVSILGILLGVLVLSGGSSSTVVNGQRVTVSTIGPALFFIVPYALSLLALILSRRHFRSS